MELSPGSIRTFVVGTAYQLGNLASSASSTIEAKLGANFPLPPITVKGKVVHRYKYGKVICIFMGAVFVYVLVLTFLGPERLGRDLTVAHDADMKSVVKRDGRHEEDEGHDGSSEEEKVMGKEREGV